MKRRALALASAFILVIIIITIIPLSTYFTAESAVTNAVSQLKVDVGAKSSISMEASNVLYSNNFSVTNEANIPLTLEYVNVTVYVSSVPSNLSQYAIGSIIIRNETVKASKQISFPVLFNVTSENALNLMHSSNYNVGWKAELTASGSYMFWHFSKQKTIQIQANELRLPTANIKEFSFLGISLFNPVFGAATWYFNASIMNTGTSDINGVFLVVEMWSNESGLSSAVERLGTLLAGESRNIETQIVTGMNETGFAHSMVATLMSKDTAIPESMLTNENAVFHKDLFLVLDDRTLS